MTAARFDWWTGLTGDAPHARQRMTVRAVGRGFTWSLLPFALARLQHIGAQALRELDPVAADPMGNADSLLEGFRQLGPVFLACVLAGGSWQWVFAAIRRRSTSSGLLATALIVTLALPPTIPLWQAAVAMSFGMVLAQEVFGGTGMNVVHPALVALAFVTLAYPTSMRGGPGWVPASHSVPACALGAGFLLARRLISWRVLAGGVIGLGASAATFGLAGPGQPLAEVTEQLTAGAFLFGLVFVATDPASSAATSAGRWLYGALIGLLTLVLRVMTPAQGEVVFPAILLANLAAPLIDHGVVLAYVRRRRRRSRHA